MEDYILIYRIAFDSETHFPSVMEILYHYHSGLYMETMLNLQDLAC